MKYNFFLILLIVLITSCTSNNYKTVNVDPILEKFSNNGFALIYNDKLYKDNIVNNKIEDRSLIIFQKNLKAETSVKVTNLLNSKHLIAKVGKKTIYPSFYNSVISKRISNELKIDPLEPYIEIVEIIENSSLVKKAKTFDEEKKVADKAPVDDILIKNLGTSKKKKIAKSKSNFNYLIKIADFYFKKSANEMKTRILNDTSIKNIKVDKISPTRFRVYIGPFKKLDSLKKAYKDIDLLNFENIEIIKK